MTNEFNPDGKDIRFIDSHYKDLFRANPDLPICWRMMVRLFAKRARKISPKPCIIWCMIAEHLWKKSMMTGVLSFMRLNMTLWTVPVSC